ncbi:MAG: ABC transporter ATP-binding protein [Hyphomicrobiales bacterium]|nr:ABC transporter ATP-binding protein [Hyphomicrobiales bacterium]
MTILLDVKGLKAGYGPVEVVHGLDFTVEEGGVTALLGANGAGKTTILRALCGMIRREGSLQFAGRDLCPMTTEEIVRCGIAHVPDGRGTFTGLTVSENLTLGAYVRRDKAAVADDLAGIFVLFPRLKERLFQQAGTLSGGEQQMLAIARALILRPRLLLLDEPSFGLAPLVVKDIFATLRQINAMRQVSLLIVEQNVRAALDLADHAVLIETGTVALAGPASLVSADDAVRRAYLGY